MNTLKLLLLHAKHKFNLSDGKHGSDQSAGIAATSFRESDITVCIPTLVRDATELVHLLQSCEGTLIGENRPPLILTKESRHLNLTCGFVVFTCSPVLGDRRPGGVKVNVAFPEHAYTASNKQTNMQPPSNRWMILGCTAFVLHVSL